ncbi:MAG: flagellar type III secretion system protein FlhB [Methylophilaceae bacterium]|nr:flagellar type III secretion system protein FlhB [Methylophilaceae bacterium]
MAEDSDMEKTEPATPKRLEKAREEGDVPRSREMVTCTMLLAMGLGLWMLGGNLTQALKVNLSSGLTLERQMAFDPYRLLVNIAEHLGALLWAFVPLAGLMLVVAIASPVLLGGWLFSGKALMPNFMRMNPISGLANLVSANALVELLKAVAKALVVGTAAYVVVSSQLEQVLSLPLQPLHSGMADVTHLLLVGFFTIVAALVLIAAVDVPYQLIHYANKHKMTKEEVRQESKESEGNPEIKAKIRQQQREMARRRMMAEIPNADVVITNPTHYAVAIKYKSDAMRAPIVVAKGADAVAMKIREIAGENNITIMEAPKLARALYAHTELGDAIPEALYSAVAEVLAYIFQMRIFSKQGGVRPQVPAALDVPEALDPHNDLNLQSMLAAGARS